MKARLLIPLATAMMALAASSSIAQTGNTPNQIAPIYREQSRMDRRLQAQEQADQATKQTRPRIDYAGAQRDMAQLQKLTQTVSKEVHQVGVGVLDRNTGSNLKKMEKLCKRLRSELQL